MKKIEVIANYYVDADALKSEFGQTDLQFAKTDLYTLNGLKKPETWLKEFFSFFQTEDPVLKALKEHTHTFLFYNFTSHMYKKLNLEKLPKEKMVLFMWEPPTVLRKMYRKERHQFFRRVYTWDDDLVDNQFYFKFYYPELRSMIADPIPFEQKKLCTLVSSNATSRYLHELYSARKKAIAFFEEHHPEDFDFYGRGWDAKQFKTYKGAIKDKTQVVKQYRFSICYENTCHHKGYITEKIFDCFHAANVPVYWGASNVEDYIPKNCFIDARDFDDLEKLYQFLKDMDKATYQNYLKNIKHFLKSEKAQKFSKKHFQEIVLKCIHEN